MSGIREASDGIYLLAGLSVEQVKLAASFVSPEPLYQAFCG